jgi:fructose-bisphosphate aldolase class I
VLSNRLSERAVISVDEFCLALAGVITFEETLMKHDSQLAESKYKGKSFVDILKSRGVVPGIKVDKGTVVLPRTSPEETSTQGLDGLLERSQQYYERGARFSKWRATVSFLLSRNV